MYVELSYCPTLSRAILVLAIFGATIGAGPAPDDGILPTTPTVFDDPALVMHYQHTITSRELSTLLHDFASDDFEGRETGTPGQHRAAAWLAQRYADMKIDPAQGPSAPNGPYTQDYLQPVPVYGRELEQSMLSSRRMGAPDITYSYAPREPIDQVYLASGTVPTVSGSVEFRAVDLSDAALEYQEYSVLQRRETEEPGNWVMAFAPDDLIQPAEKDGAHRSTSVWPRLRLQTELDATNPLPLGYLLIASEEHVRTTGSLVAEQALSVGALSLSEPSATYPFPPVFVLTPAAADSMLLGTGFTVADFHGRIAGTSASFRQPLPGLTVESKIDFPIRLFDTSNVVAWIEGADRELRNEYVIVSSHYDHIGINPLLEGDSVYNGADDNGSGTVAMVEVAKAFAEAKRDGHGPRRSIVFIHLTGEEKGLLGSAYYADQEPLFPLEQTVTNINIDMIGRFDPSHPHQSENYVYVIGSRMISQELHEINERVNELTGVDLELDERFSSRSDPNRFYRRSDHWNFGKHGIPFIFFFTGSHEDYHRPGDEAPKIEYERMTRIARLIFATTWQVANQDDRPALSGEGFN